jgi:hypothetical protein
MMAQSAIGASKAKPHPAFVGDSIYPPGSKTSGTAEAESKKHRSYRPLPTRFRHSGFDYKQIAREGSAAIYEQIWHSYAIAAVCYEVVRIRQREGFQIGDRFIEPAEVYPNSEAWGVDGWTVHDREAAFRKLRAVAVSGHAIQSVVLRSRGTIKGKRCRKALQIRREKEKAEKPKRKDVGR